MLRQDYIQRLIREFFAALERLLEKNEAGERQEAIRKMFTQYLGDSAFFHIASLDDIMRWLEKYPEDERLSRIEMLAELYYAEADLMSEPTRSAVLDRAYMLFDYIDRNGRTFSMERLKKMKKITEMKEHIDG